MLLDCSKDHAVIVRNIRMRAYVLKSNLIQCTSARISLAKRISTARIARDIRATDFPVMQRCWQPFINRDVRCTLQSAAAGAAGVERERETGLPRKMFRPRYRRIFLTMLNLYKVRKSRVFLREINPTCFPLSPSFSLPIRTLICCINVWRPRTF